MSSNRKKVVEVVTSQGSSLAAYVSAREAARILEIGYGHIGDVCRGVTAHSHGYLFRYASIETELNPLTKEELIAAKKAAVERGEHEEPKIQLGRKGMRVSVVTSQGHVLATYESQVDVFNRTGIDKNSIGQVMSKRALHAKGFIFEAAEPDAELNQLSLDELKEALEGAIERDEHEACVVESIPLMGRKKKVKVVTSEGHVLAVYDSASDAAVKTGMNAGNITKSCTGRRNNVGDFTFRYADADAENLQLSLEELQEAKKQAIERGEHVEPDTVNPKKAKKIHVVTSIGVVLATYESATEAQRRTGIKSTSIGHACMGKRKRARTFKFRFAEPDADLNQLSFEELQAARQSALERGDENLEALSRPPKKEKKAPKVTGPRVRAEKAEKKERSKEEKKSKRARAVAEEDDDGSEVWEEEED